jgi:hypothetical protein
MNLRGDYDAVEDRIVLTLWDGTVSGGNHLLWVTRRQWLAIAAACYRTRSSAALEGEQFVTPRKKAADPEGQTGFGGATPIPEGSGHYVVGGESVKVSLVSDVKFQRIPSGLRMKLTTEARGPLYLPLKGENFPLFIKLVERLAARAKWDLPAAISRMKNGESVQKEFVN